MAKLPGDLPTDWTLGMTVAPEGADAGLPERYGYNYLMRQVNAAQQAVNEAAGIVEMPPGGESPPADRRAGSYYLKILADYAGGEG